MNDTFTFQSGDIQIDGTIVFLVYPKKFTFQSGDIQIFEQDADYIYAAFNLHSNLVIFKLRHLLIPMSNLHIYIPIWWYSNIYTEMCSVQWQLFTFQSGDIQIEMMREAKRTAKEHLHSNLVIFKSDGTKTKMPHLRFTFQSGDIQMEIKMAVSYAKKHLHSNLVIFK